MTRRKPQQFHGVSLRSVGMCRPGEHFLRMDPVHGGRSCDACTYHDGPVTSAMMILGNGGLPGLAR